MQNRSTQAVLKLIERESCKGHSYFNLFTEMLDYFISLFSHGAIPAPQDRPWLDQLPEAMADCEPFADAFGTLYMDLAGRGHQSNMGQFFTPENIAEMMAAMIIDPAKSVRPFRICDPTCGSGVMILKSAKALRDTRHLHRWYAGDLDITCVKMTVVQCAINCIPAFVMHANTLTLKTYSGYLVDLFWYQETPEIGGWLPIIRKLREDELDVFAKSPMGTQMQQEAIKRDPALLFDVQAEAKKDKPKPKKEPKQKPLPPDAPTLF